MRLVHCLRAFVLLLTALAALTTFAQDNVQPPKNQAVTAAAVHKVRPAYSVFQGTIVDMSWPEIKNAADRSALILLPIGVIEQHGPHMGLGADTYQAHALSKILKERLQGQNIEAIVLPVMYWGVMQKNESGAFPGSFTVRPETMKALLTDELADVKAWGFKNVFIVDTHGDRVHDKTVDELIPEAEKTLGIDIFNGHDGEGNGKPHPTINPYTVGNPFKPDYHAGAVETALMETYFPGDVDKDLARTLKPEATWQPLGYVGDPAGFENVNTQVFEAQIEYLKDNIVAWLTAKDAKKSQSAVK